MRAQRLVWQVLAVFFCNVLGADGLTEYGSTAELYEELLVTTKYSFVYIYATRCHWCQELTPKFQQLEGLFGGKINFIMIDGRKSRILGKDFNVASYPYMLLFEPALNLQDIQLHSEVSPKDLVRSIYNGAQEVSNMAYYLTELTGEVSHWPHSPNDNVVDLAQPRAMDQFIGTLNSYWGSIFGTTPVLDDSPMALLSFTIPWMDIYYQDMFQTEDPLPFVDDLSQIFNEQVKFFTVDGSQTAMSNISNIFRVMNFPSLILLPQRNDELISTIVSIEFHEYDRQIFKKELSTVKRIIELCLSGNLDALTKCVNDFHSAEIYQSLQEMQEKINNSEASSKTDTKNDEMELNRLFDNIRDM